MASNPVGAWLPPHEPPYQSARLTRRTRKEHRKSRNGCQICKRRHVRCDEGQPICTNCLTRGDPCGYDGPDGPAPLVPSGERPSVPVAGPSRAIPLPARLGAVPADPFDSLEIEMPYNSHQLLHHFLSYRSELRKLVFAGSDIPEGTLTVKFTVNPTYTRGLMLMAAKHNYGLTGQCEWSRERTFLHHKAEVIRSLREQVNTYPANPGQWSFSVIFFLVSMESLDRNHQAAEVHIKGLIALMRTIQPQQEALYASGRTLLRLGLLFFSLIEAAKRSSPDSEFSPTQWRHSHSPFAPDHSWDWVNVAYLLSLIVTEFLMKGDYLIGTSPGDPANVACLQWLVTAIRSMRTSDLQRLEGQEHNLSERQTYRDPQQKIWVLASVCYALLLASLSGVTPDFNDEHPANELQALHRWWDEKVVEWLESETLPSYDLSLEVLSKVAWLTTAEGEGVIGDLRKGIVAKIGG